MDAMTFDLFTPELTAYVYALLAVAVVAGVVALGALTAFFVGNHRIRVARHESIPTYYGRLALAH